MAPMPDPRAADVTIRRAGANDVPELARLRWEFTAELHPGLAVEARQAFDRRFAQSVDAFLAEDRWTIWVAEASGRLVGTLWVERVDKVPRPYPRPEHWGYITNVYVVPSHRNAGVGGRILEAAVEAARTDGWEQLLLWQSEASGRFYARSGFRPDVDLLALHVTQDSGEAGSAR